MALCAGVGQPVRVFVGETAGVIVSEARGPPNAFGWDPVFQPLTHSLTFAQMSLQQKNAVSHRRKALTQLQEWLQQNHQLLRQEMRMGKQIQRNSDNNDNNNNSSSSCGVAKRRKRA